MARGARDGNGYSVHPSLAYVQAVVDGLRRNTGRTLEEWVRLVNAEGPPGEKERRDWLKARHGLGGTTAWLVAERAAGKGQENSDPDAYLRAAAGWVEAMFAGPRAGLRPLYDRLV